VPSSGVFVNANGDLTVDLRSDIAAESRAKIVYEYLMQFTDDPHVKESLGFLMTRVIAHMQMFTAALNDVQPNFPPGILQGDPRATHTYFNLSNGEDVRRPWNQGQRPWPAGEEWVYIHDPIRQVQETEGQKRQKPVGTFQTREEKDRKAQELSKARSRHIKEASGSGEQSWSDYTRHLEPSRR
jgi:Mn-containing catalase